MKYEISKATTPAMPNLGKGTECVKLLLSQASKVMHEPLVPMFFPVLGAHMSGTEFQYPDNSWKEPTGMMAYLVAKSGDNKGQLSCLVEAICRDFRQHDDAETKRLLGNALPSLRPPCSHVMTSNNYQLSILNCQLPSTCIPTATSLANVSSCS